jgi:hypothetical protein
MSEREILNLSRMDEEHEEEVDAIRAELGLDGAGVKPGDQSEGLVFILQ